MTTAPAGAINKSALFWAACMSLLVTSLSFGIRAGILGGLGVEFNLNASELGTIAATAFWGFPLAVILGGFVVDLIGMKKLLVMAFLLHLLGIILTIFAGGYWSLFLSTLTIGIANGTVEAACNPLVTSLYPENKTTKLNHFHLWFPGGIVIGTLLVYFLSKVGVSWQIQVGLMLLPTLGYGYLFSKLDFPPTERVASGVSTGDMFRALLAPLFWFMLICMMGTGITELFTEQWIEVLLQSVTDNGLLVVTITATVSVIGRAFAEPVVHKLAPQGVLLISAILATIGIYLLGHSSGTLIFVGALIFGMGVCYFWPTMLGFVSENLPKTGAIGINLVGGAGMFSVSIFSIIMSGKYDQIVAAKLPAGADLHAYNAAPAGSDMANLFIEAKRGAGPEILDYTLIIPIVLVFAFAGLVFYVKQRKSATI